jgi:hypothetical protein
MNFKFIALAFTFVFALFVTGCGSTAGASTPDPSASAAQAVETSTTPAPDDSIKQFGAVKTYADGVSISVSKPAPFVASQTAVGAVKGQIHVVYTIVLTNGSKEVLDPSVSSSVSSGGVEAKGIFDTGNAIGDIGGRPNTPILPGKTVKWLEAYSLADPKSVTFQAAPTYSYEKALFTNIPK